MVELIKKFKYLKPLYLILKKILDNHNLTDPSRGGLKSICLIYMIVAFLKKYLAGREKEFADSNLQGIGVVFHNLLYFYAYTFDY